MKQETLNEILQKHAAWRHGELGGERANLTGANLTGANLTDANLTDAYLAGANLAGANLTDADLANADLANADLTDANLTGADLAGANLTDADLTGADLTDANLASAELTDANLDAIKQDLYDVLSHARAEVPALLAALREGRVDGSTYSGPCACLVGTIANARGCAYNALGDLRPNADRPAEVWFLAIHKGDTPATNQVSAITVQWVEAWIVQQFSVLPAPVLASTLPPALGWERARPVPIFMSTDSAVRKGMPVTSGVLNYFPDALLCVAFISRVGNDKHNPGEPLHWAKDKSQDEPDCEVRHMLDWLRDLQPDPGLEPLGELGHLASKAWRALAHLQRECDRVRKEHEAGKP